MNVDFIDCKCALLSLLIVLYASTAQAQAPEAAVSLPVSPNAASLGEYGNTPVSLAIGAPDIEIPVFKVKGRTLELPISLTYRASGIKVEDAGSHVGMGWSLNAGGVISRAIRGNGERGVNAFADGTKEMVPKRIEFFDNDLSDDNMLAYHNGSDAEPDIYYYNFLKYSGKFLFENDGKPVIYPHMDFDVQFLWQDPDGIVIRDNDGVTYSFSSVEYSDPQEGNSYYNSVGSNWTAWYLTKIVSADKLETIEFAYDGEWIFQESAKREQILVFPGATSTGGFFEINRQPFGDRVESYTKRLRRITSNFGYRVELLPGIARPEIDGGAAKAIGSIQIYFDDVCIKTVDLQTEIIETNLPTTDQIRSWANYRMYLKSIVTRDCSNQNSTSYKFSYYGQENGRDNLPNRLSYAQDHWGYYNGQTSNNTLRPSWEGYAPGANPAFVSLPGANRSAGFPEAQYGTLASITYPTGGKTIFSFNSHSTHDGEPIGGLRVQAIRDYDIDGVLLRTKRYEYSDGHIVTIPQYSQGNFYYMNGRLFTIPSMDCDRPNCFQYGALVGGGLPVALGTTNGSHISYGVVKEIEEGNGFKQYIYTTAKDYGDYATFPYSYARIIVGPTIYMGCDPSRFTRPDNVFPMPPYTDLSWQRGFLVLEQFFREGEISPFKYLRNDYDYSLSRSLKCNAIAEVPVYCEAEGKNINNYYYTIYTNRLGIPRVIKTTEFDNGILTYKTHDYEGAFLAKTTETESNGDVRVTEFQHAKSGIFDTSPSLGSDLLRNIHNYNSKIRTIKTVNGTVVYKQENKYETPLGNSIPFLTSTSEYPHGVTLGNTVGLSYATSGAISTSQKRSDLKTCYLWDYHNTSVVAVVSNSEFTDIAYSSFETAFKGGWDYIGVVKDANGVFVPTGTKYYQLSSNTSLTHSGMSASKPYRLTFWCRRGGTVSVTGGSQSDIKSFDAGNGWILSSRKLSATSSVTISGSGDIDEVRISPDAADITTYTYDHPGKLTSVTDRNGFTTYYQFDSLDRVIGIKDAKGNLLKTFTYNLWK